MKLYIKVFNEKGRLVNIVSVILFYVCEDVFFVIVFCVFGIVFDEDILNYICYDCKDIQMFEVLWFCIEEVFCIQD